MMIKRSLEQYWIAGGFGLVLLLVSLVSYVSYQNAVRLIASANKVRHTNEILKTLTDVVTTLTDAEAGRRGYILRQDEEELERYNTAIQSIHPQMAKLERLFANDSEQRQRLAKVGILITQRLSLYRHSTDLFQNQLQSDRLPSIDRQESLVNQIKQNKQELRQIVQQMQTKENQLLQFQLNQSQIGFRVRMGIEFAGTCLTVIVILGVYGLLYRQMRRRQEAENLQRALAQAKELSELKLKFFSMVSHEFRTPLSIILGSAQLLEEEKQRIDPRKLKNIHRIQSAAKLMTKLLTDILTFARAEAGKLECKPELIDLESFCLNLVEDIQSATATEPIIKLLNHSEYTHAYLDEKLLYSILNNLLSNAVKYSPQVGEIQFLLNSEPGSIVFIIQDQGIGIPPEDLQTLYEPFHRSSNVGQIVGTGLGLAVVKKCVELHKGHIEVHSQVDRGTTVTVKIPQPTRLPSF